MAYADELKARTQDFALRTIQAGGNTAENGCWKDCGKATAPVWNFSRRKLPGRLPRTVETGLRVENGNSLGRS